ncbi:MAG: hypothetical protein PHQ40_04805 [Anaerolineaceae bacterium]|nr:hypothetical protein [Anaerolineaceae bacterium]
MRAAPFLLKVYTFLLHGYPRSYRETYGEEVATVFQRMLSDASAQSAWRVGWVFLREMGELPFHLLAAYFSQEQVSVMIEKALTNPKRSRWQQAGALGFALGFALLEMLNGIAHIPNSGLGRFVSWNGWISVNVLNTPQGTYEVAPFHFLAVPMSAAAGLVAGLILGRAEIPSRSWRYALGGAASLAGAYGLLYACSLLVQMIPFGQWFISAAFNLLSIVLLGAFVALLLGLFTRGLHTVRLFRQTLAGLAGYIAGLLTLVLVKLALWLIFTAIGLLAAAALGKGANWSVLVSLLAPWFSWGIGILGSAAMGWVFGSWVGRELGPQAPGEVRVIL